MIKMRASYEISAIRKSQVDMAAVGAEIFALAIITLAQNTPQAYADKPLDCLVFDFERTYPKSPFCVQDDTIASEKLRVSLTDLKRLDEYDYTGQESDIFVFPTMTDGVKKLIHQQIKIAGEQTLSSAGNKQYYMPACAITTKYSLGYHNGQGLEVDSADYRPLKQLLVSGRIFAQEVLQYMHSEIYQKFPSGLPGIERDQAIEEGRMLHSAKISFAARPPLNGREPKAWLESYAKWLRSSIKQMTFGPEDPKSAKEFRGIADSAMDDGILLMCTVDAIRQAKS